MTPTFEFDPSIQKDYQKVVAEGQLRRIAEGAVLRGQIVKFGSDEEYAVAAGANEPPIGIALNSVSLADIAAYADDINNRHRVELSIATIGFAPLLAGAEVVEGNFIKSDAAGRGVPITGDGTDWIVGKAYKDASGDGEEFHILINLIPATVRG